MKIYFGRIPKTSYVNIDETFSQYLEAFGYSYETTVNALANFYKFQISTVLHTVNPMFLQWLEEEFLKDVYFIDPEGNEVNFINDPICQEKYKLLGAGEVLVDDSRVFN